MYRLLLIILLLLPFSLSYSNKSLTYLNRILKSSSIKLDKNMNRMSSGSQLLTDNPAYFAIYEKLEAHIRGMDQYIHNHSDMYNYYQFEEAVLASISESLQHIRELSLRMSNGMMGEFERDIIKGEMSQYYDQILYELTTGQFNKVSLFKDFFKDPLIKNHFKDPEYYQIARIDALMHYFIKRRVILGAQMNRLKHKISAIAIDKENTAAFQSQGDTDYGTEMADFKKNQLLMMINMMMLSK